MLWDSSLTKVQTAEMLRDKRLPLLLPTPDRQAVLERFPQSVFLLPARPISAVTNRLVLLIPFGAMDIGGLARLITQMTAGTDLSVLLIGISIWSRQARENIHWSLAHLEPSLKANGLRVTSRLVDEREFLSQWRRLFQDGDLCVCLHEHRILKFGWLGAKLAPLVARRAARPVYVLTGFRARIPHPAGKKLKELVGWGTAMGLITAGFLALIRIWPALSDTSRSVGALFWVLVMFVVLQIINNWMG